MFLNFLDELRSAGIPASLKEHLLLLEALDADVIDRTPEDFYYLARATYVKDEGLLDRFDQVFAKVFKGIAAGSGALLLVVMAAIAVFLIWKAIPAFTNNTGNLLTTQTWNPQGDPPVFGMAACAPLPVAMISKMSNAPMSGPTRVANVPKGFSGQLCMP